MCDIANAAVQKRLLTEPKLTFTKAATIAQPAELAEKGSRELQSVWDPPKDIYKFSHLTNSKESLHKQEDVGSNKSSTGNCYRCGGKHNQFTCCFKSEMCCFCNKRGHIAKVCKSRKAQSSQNKAADTGDSSKATHQVTQDS